MPAPAPTPAPTPSPSPRSYIHKGEIFWTLNVSSADAFTGASLADGNPKGSILTGARPRAACPPPASPPSATPERRVNRRHSLTAPHTLALPDSAPPPHPTPPPPLLRAVVKLVNLLDGGKAPLDGDAYFEGSFNSTDILPAAGYNTTELFSHFDMGHIYLQLESAGGKVYGAVEKDAPKAAPAPGAAPEHMHGRKMLL